MFDYSQMNPQKFEELAKVYLETEFPDYQWNITERSGDGNRDVFCRYTFADAEVEYWAEAKFTAGSSKASLKKGQLDPTLVSAFLYPKPIAKIRFISNNTVPEHYFYRLEDFHIKTSIGVQIVAKREFEQWLMLHPEICERFHIFREFSKSPLPEDSFEDSEIKIDSALITLQSQEQPYFSESILYTKNKYALYLLINNNTQKYKNVHISLQPSSIFSFTKIRMEKDDTYSLNCGISAIKVFITPTEEFSGDIIVKILDSDSPESVLESYRIKGIKCLHPKIMHIFYAQQSKLLAQLMYHIQNGSAHNEIIYISGAGAAGKTYLLSNLQKNLNDCHMTHYFAFTGNFLSDGELFCRILIYLNLGDALNQSLECLLEIVHTLNVISEQKLFLETLIMKLQEGAGAAINHLLKSTSNLTQLVFPCHHLSKSIIIVDDLQKASTPMKKLLNKCIQDFSFCTNNQVLICGSRESSGEWLDERKLDLDCVVYHEQLHGLSADDKKDTARYYFPEVKHLEFDSCTDDLLTFSSVTANLINETNKKEMDFLSKCAFIQKGYKTGKVSNKSILKIRLKKYSPYNHLIELVYFVHIGIDYRYLIREFQPEHIQLLLDEKIFLGKDQKIYPFHDLYVESFFEMHTPSNKIASRILDLASYDKQRDYRYFELILSLGPANYMRFCPQARLIRNRYFKKTELYPAYILAESIVKHRPDYQPADKEYLQDLFVLASSAFYEKSSADVIEIYQKILDCGQELQGIPNVDHLMLHAKTEIVNQEFWLLNTNGLIDKINRIQDEIVEPSPEMSHDEKYALLNCFNRKMVIYLLMDQYDKAKDYFDQSIKYAQELDEPAYEGFAHMDYARGLSLHDIKAAIAHMEYAQKIFSTLDYVRRRKMECDCEVSYLHCISFPNANNIRKLTQSAAILRNNHYWELYAKAELKIAAIQMLSGHMDEAEVSRLIITSEYVLPSIPTNRFQLISSHIKYLYYSSTKNSVEAEKAAQKYYRLSRDLGPFYQQIGERQLSGYSTPKVICATKENLNWEPALLLDPRVW